MNYSLFRLLIIVSCVLLTSCSSLAPDSQEPSYYLLDNQLANGQKTNLLTLGVQLEIADYLQRPQLALRSSDLQIQFSDYHRWASELRGLLLNSLRIDLGLALDTDRIFSYPWRLQDKVQYTVAIDIQRLDGRLGEQAYLQARVEYNKTQAMKQPSQVANYALSQSLAGDSHNDLVTAERELLKQLSNSIALTIKSMQEK